MTGGGDIFHLLMPLGFICLLIHAGGETFPFFSTGLAAGKQRDAPEECGNEEGSDERRRKHATDNTGTDGMTAVGTGTGIPTLSLCEQSKRRWPDLQIISGGGVHSGACLLKAQAAGLDGLLIASALHDGRLTADDIAAVHSVGARDNMQ